MTTELIKTTGITLNGDKITAVNARDLWKFLESKQEFANWIKDRIRKYGFKEGLDFTVDKIINGENKGRFAANEYFISLDMAKELAMEENNERGHQARQYFIEVKKRYRHTGSLEENHLCRPYAKLSTKMNNTAHVWNWPGTSCPTAIPATSIPSDRRKQIPPQLLRRSERARHLASDGKSDSAGLFEEIPINLMSGQFGTLSETAA